MQVQKITLGMGALAAEMNCEEEKANQFAVWLADSELNRERKLPAAAIVAGATAPSWLDFRLAEAILRNTLG